MILDVVVGMGHARMENVRILGIRMLDMCFLKVKLLEPVYAKFGKPKCWIYVLESSCFGRKSSNGFTSKQIQESMILHEVYLRLKIDSQL